MTRDYALFLLNQLCIGASVEAMPIITQPELSQALSVALKALEQQPCEDCISRQAVMNIISFEYGWLIDAKEYNTNIRIAFNGLMSRVKALPSVTPTRPTARWERSVDDYNKCSICGELIKSYRNYKYCPNCGARMAESEDKE